MFEYIHFSPRKNTTLPKKKYNSPQEKIQLSPRKNTPLPKKKYTSPQEKIQLSPRKNTNVATSVCPDKKNTRRRRSPRKLCEDCLLLWKQKLVSTFIHFR
jgi:hypothetical protein